MKNLNEYEWYCNNCNEHLNEQSGFVTDCDSWTCTICGKVNYIKESEILDERELGECEKSE